MNFMAVFLVISILCPAIIAYYVIKSLSEIKKLEETTVNVSSFCVYIKYSRAMVHGFIAILASLFPAVLFLCMREWIDVFMFIIFLLYTPIFYIFSILIFMPLRRKLIIKENQITEIYPFSVKRVFTFESIKKADICYGKTGANLQLINFHDNKMLRKYINFKYNNNIDLFIERLKTLEKLA